jgi:Protein of unknown function (DUF2793)/GDSL-like Lipase/Acylhydrolase family/Alpha-L-arabinofuranosidase B, catalytic
MDITPNLKLPYIVAAQAQKHVTHNEALRLLDAAVQIAVADRDLASPPATPVDGARYIVAASPTGAWASHAGHIAAFQDGAWAFLIPLEGWLAWVADEDKLLVYTGAAWDLAAGGIASLNPVPLVGVNATADTTNRLTVSAPATLLNHAGSGHQLKINKNAAPETASLLYQTGFSGRAEFGLTGDDDFHLKVSADGTAWQEALVVGKATAALTFAKPPRIPTYLKAALPDAVALAAGSLIFVSDAPGGPAVMVSDGTKWLPLGSGSGTTTTTTSIKARAPAATDDAAKGYNPQAYWFDTAASLLYVCTSATPGAAVWAQVTVAAAALLDQVATAAAAYGVIKLRAAYTGKAFQIKRASDNTILDVGFLASGFADFASADTFVGASTGTFTKWFDQSGNGLDAVAGTNAPQLSFNTVNGLRAVTVHYGGGGGLVRSFVLPAALALAKNNFSAVMAMMSVAPAQGATAYFSLGNDANYQNNVLLLSNNTGRGQVFSNVFPVFPPFEAQQPTVAILSSSATALSLTANETTSVAASPLTAATMAGGAIGTYPGYLITAEFLAFALYPRALSASETTSVRNWAYTQFKITPQVVDRLILLGDSITAGADADPALPWSRQMQALITARPYKVLNQGASGQTAAWFDTNFAANTTPLKVSGLRNMLIASIGTNDLNAGTTTAAVYTSLTSIVAKAKADGFSPVGLATILPRANTSIAGGGAAFETLRNDLNAKIRANTAGADFIADVAADPTMGAYANINDTTLWTGALHPTAKGAGFLAAVYAAAINARG